MLLWSSDKTGCKKLNIDETCLPEACSMFCVETVKIIKTAKCNISAGSEQFASLSKRPCLWQRINVRSFFLSTFFRIILHACRAASATLRKSSIDEPAKLLFNAANGSLYSVAVKWIWFFFLENSWIEYNESGYRSLEWFWRAVLVSMRYRPNVY